jgi:predicted nucleic acid-binding protein
MSMPASALAEQDEVLAFVDQHRLYEKGIRFIDAHLLASVALMPGTALWTRDRRLLSIAKSLGCAFEPAGRS